MRIGGYLLLFAAMMILNMVALIRWPFAALFRTVRSGSGQKATEKPGTVLEANPRNLDALLQGHDPLLLDFWAEWCGPCIVMNEPLKQLAQEDGGCTIAKVNTVAHPELARQYNVKGLPTLILYRKGREVKRYAGALGYAELRAFVMEGPHQ